MNRGNNLNGLGVIVVAIIVCTALAMSLGGSDLIAGWAAGQRAAYANARAAEVAARADLVISEAAANAIRTDTAQTWMLPLILAGVVFLLLCVIILQAWRATTYEHETLRQIAAEETRIAIAVANLELAHKMGLAGIKENEPPTVKGRLAEFEESVTMWGVEL